MAVVPAEAVIRTVVVEDLFSRKNNNIAYVMMMQNVYYRRDGNEYGIFQKSIFKCSGMGRVQR
ncbi:hypothetical protein DET56_11754 [Paenibacillus pabuli]|uniref:Uncharacterized protein n=1 Tax=Paenibacillus pabuli TaxID=1472 RepID=A0A855Y131_9BACL|nr:hypothetical protein DET56_11754 [Paenibacillus pabuli]PXV99975.1 hypothetical protein DEU73_11653 [Paenibacillus taichungensis]